MPGGTPIYQVHGRRRRAPPSQYMNIIEIDDAIPKLFQSQIEAETTSTRMTWSIREESARSSAVLQASYGGFSHIAYHIKDQSPSFSPMTAMLLPMPFMFCQKANLEFNALLRIRLGLFPRNPTTSRARQQRIATRIGRRGFSARSSHRRSATSRR
jgi:hypothetical protein